MGTASQLLVGFGPPLLVGMGIALCVAYPVLRSGRWAFLAAFLVLGIPVCVAAFLAERPSVVSNAAATHNAAQTGTAEKTPRGGSNGHEERITRRTPDAEVIRAAEHPRGSLSPEVRPTYITIRQQPYQRVSTTRRGVRSNRLGTRGVVVVIRPQARTNAAFEKPSLTANGKIPPNTLSCTGFTRDPEGTWEAGDDTRPFDVGSDTNYTVRDEGPIRQGWLTIGTVDLYALLNEKCGGSSKSKR